MGPNTTDSQTATDTSDGYNEDDTSMQLSADSNQANDSASTQPPDFLPEWAAMLIGNKASNQDKTKTNTQENVDDQDMEAQASNSSSMAP